MSKMAALRCFQIDHAVSMTRDAVPFRAEEGDEWKDSCHQAAKESPAVGGVQVERIHESTSYQRTRENGHSTRRWFMVSKVLAIRRPSPRKDINGVREVDSVDLLPNPNVLPKSQRPKSPLDVTDPTPIRESLTDRAGLSDASRDELVEVRSQLREGPSINSPVLPE